MKVKKVQDCEGDWYWIPLELLKQFIGFEYMEKPDEFDKFMEQYSHFRTGGSSDVTPTFFELDNTMLM